jgi:hypothetical protein
LNRNIKRNWITIFILAVLFSGIPVSSAQNAGDIIIDDPIQINDDLIGRYTIENPGTCEAQILCEVWRTDIAMNREHPDYTVNVKGIATHQLLTVLIDVDSSHEIGPYDEYTSWKIPIPGMDNFDVKTTAKKR